MLVIQRHDQCSLEKEVFIWSLQFHRDKSPPQDGEVWQPAPRYGGRKSWELILKGNQGANRDQWKSTWPLKPQGLPPVMGLLQQDHTPKPTQTVPPTWEQAFRCLRF